MSKDPKWWTILRFVLLGIAIITQCWLAANYGRINHDETYSVAEAQSLVHGYGLTIPAIRTQDLGNIPRLHTLSFPVGYSIVYAVFFALSIDPGIADFLIEVIAAVLFFVSWFVILENLRHWISVPGRLVIWVFWIMFPAPLMAGAIQGHSSDNLAVAVFSASIAMVVTGMVDRREKRLFSLSILGGILMGMAASLKYVYWPNLAIVPLTFAILSLLNHAKWRRYLFAAGLFSIAGGLILAALMLDARLTTGHFSGYVMSLTGRIYPKYHSASSILWDQLFFATPSPVFAFGLAPYGFCATLDLLPLYLVGDRAAWLFTIFIIGMFILSGVSTIWRVYQDREIKSSESTMFFVAAALVTVFWVYLWQIYLSVIYTFDYDNFATITIIRYVNLALPFLFIGVVQGILAPLTLKNKDWRHYAVAILLSLSLVFPFYAAYRFRSSVFESNISMKWKIRAQSTYLSRTKWLRSANEGFEANDYPLVVVFPDKDKGYEKTRQTLFMTGTPGVILPETGLKVSTPVNIVLRYRQDLPVEELERFEKIVQEHNASCFAFDDYYHCTFTLSDSGLIK
ncbi:MAG: hypothetical protein JXA13_07620 [Anaerolineales bacterium]|nr:hypothetical protein [Anaerolineales bacterium]